MKRQNFKAQLMISGIVLGTLLAALAVFFFQTNLFRSQLKWCRAEAISMRPMTGHWLKTDMDKWYNPVPEIPKEESLIKTMPVSPVYNLESAKTALNRGMDALNVMYVWSDDDQLKVISITSFNKITKQAAIVVIPLDTVVEGGKTINPEDRWETIRDVYLKEGREAVRVLLENKLEIKIPNFVHVNQPALKKLSDIIGVLQVNGDKTTMLEAFEQTAAGLRNDDRDVVRAVASQILRPQMLLEVPRLIWIFTHDINTNFTTKQMITIFHFSRQMDLGHMRKTALPGFEYIKGNLKYLFVSDQTWKNVMYEMTAV